jgi:hypothetical protein
MVALFAHLVTVTEETTCHAVIFTEQVVIILHRSDVRCW